MIKEVRTVSCDKCGQDIEGDWNEVHVKAMTLNAYHVCKGCWHKVLTAVVAIFDGRNPQEKSM